MIILALDVATSCGVCVAASDANPKAWSVDLGVGSSQSQRFANTLRMTHSLIEKYSPDLIVVEAAIGGGNASAYLISLVGCVRGQSSLMNTNCIPAHSGTVRKHFLGRAITTRDFPNLKHADAKIAIKAEVMRQCLNRGWPTTDHDAADAMAIWDWACATRVKGHQSAPTGQLFKK